MNTAIDAARAFLARLPLAVSGAGGHKATFRAACFLARFGLSEAQAMALLREWNRSHCQPPWTEKELAHKLTDARRVAGSNPPVAPRQAARVVWKIERNALKPASPIQPPARAASPAEVLPYLTQSGDLAIPFESPLRFHWWKEGGMTLSNTRRYLSSVNALACPAEGERQAQ